MDLGNAIEADDVSRRFKIHEDSKFKTLRMGFDLIKTKKNCKISTHCLKKVVDNGVDERMAPWHGRVRKWLHHHTF